MSGAGSGARSSRSRRPTTPPCPATTGYWCRSSARWRRPTCSSAPPNSGSSVARQNVAYQTESVRISQAKLDAGEVSSLDVEQGQTLLYNTRASVVLLDQSLRQLKMSLAILLGQPPQDLTERLGAPGPIPAVSPLVAVGMPQDLIRRRPDIRVAERRLAAQSAQIGVAVERPLSAIRADGIDRPGRVYGDRPGVLRPLQRHEHRLQRRGWCAGTSSTRDESRTTSGSRTRPSSN